MKYEGDGDTICTWSPWNCPQWPRKFDKTGVKNSQKVKIDNLLALFYMDSRNPDIITVFDRRQVRVQSSALSTGR